MSIEISNNTLLKILFRQGTDNDRKNIVLNSGEPGFTTDTKRLFVGDGGTSGGILTGNKFLGSVSNITTLAPAEIGDFAFNIDNNVLYRLKTNSGSVLSDWEAVASKGVTSDTTKSVIGNQIENVVRVNKTTWASLSTSRDPNSFYIVSDVNYINV